MSAPCVEVSGGHQLFLRDWGSGAPVILLAGWGMDSRLWGETMLALNDRGFRTIAYDRRGHGRSTDPGVFDYDSLADDLAAVIQRLDLHGATLVAHSGAGGEAIRYATRHGTSRLSRIVLVGATGPAMIAGPGNEDAIPRDAFEAVVDQLKTDLDGWLEDNTEPFAPGAPERTIAWLQMMVLDVSRRALIDFQREVGETDFRAEAAALKLPVTIVTGDLDVSAPPHLTARRYAKLIPEADLVIHAGVAHGIMITHPELLVEDIASRIVEER